MSEKVREMFAEISGKYDFMNNLLSFGIHHAWRRKTVKYSQAKLGEKVLDCASGTGDLAIEFKNAVGKSGKVTATDFCEDMLVFAKKKFLERGYEIDCQTADAMNLPFEDSQFDIASISFGIRNVDIPKKAIEDMARTVKPGGRVVVLEFGQPRGLITPFYKFYSRFVMPAFGKIFAGNSSAYQYLPETAAKFPCRDEFVSLMDSTGSFSKAEYIELTSGIAYIYIGTVK